MDPLNDDSPPRSVGHVSINDDGWNSVSTRPPRGPKGGKGKGKGGGLHDTAGFAESVLRRNSQKGAGKGKSGKGESSEMSANAAPFVPGGKKDGHS